jgi:hypothetical protein
MALSVQDALIHIMVVTASSDEGISQNELDAIADLVVRLHDTAYALAVEVAVIDVQLPQEELRLLEMVRDRLSVNSLVTGAIEASARARMRGL